MKKLAMVLFSLSLVLLLGSCQQLFTFSLASILARPPSVPDTITLSQADELIALALNSGDPAVAEEVLASLNDLITSGTVTGTELEALKADAGELAVQTSGISEAVTDLLPIVSTLTDIPTEAQTQEIIAALEQVSLSDSAVAALMNLQDLPEGTVEPENLAFAGMALILSSSGGVDLTTATPEELADIEATPEFIAGNALLQSAIDQMGPDAGILSGLSAFLNPTL